LLLQVFLQAQAKSARSKYFSDKIEENKNDPKKLETVKRSGVQK
jgi:hypothetical protein